MIGFPTQARSQPSLAAAASIMADERTCAKATVGVLPNGFDLPKATVPASTKPAAAAHSVMKRAAMEVSHVTHWLLLPNTAPTRLCTLRIHP